MCYSVTLLSPGVRCNARADFAVIAVIYFGRNLG
jgi:hypothetical protein